MFFFKSLNWTMKSDIIKSHVRYFQGKLEKKSNHKKASWWENYIKHNTKFRGVPLPELRKDVKNWFKTESIRSLNENEKLDLALEFLQCDFSEDKITGIFIIQLYLIEKISADFLLTELISLFEKKYIFDWNINDWLCVKVLAPMIEYHGKKCALQILAWDKAENLWRARSSIVAFANPAAKCNYAKELLKSSVILI
jgi:3-methyladenine DNA glycosylase AlkD